LIETENQLIEFREVKNVKNEICIVTQLHYLVRIGNGKKPIEISKNTEL